MTLHDKLMAEIEAYLKRTGMSARAFGVAVRGDPPLVYRLRKGHGMHVSTVERIRAYIAKNPPTSKKRPAETRPAA